MAPYEKRTFMSDVLGSSFVDEDVKAARFGKPKAKVCTAPKEAPKEAEAQPRAEQMLSSSIVD